MIVFKSHPINKSCATGFVYRNTIKKTDPARSAVPTCTSLPGRPTYFLQRDIQIGQKSTDQFGWGKMKGFP